MLGLNFLSNSKNSNRFPHRKTFSAFILLAFIILPFQNCGKFAVKGEPGLVDQSSTNDGSGLPGPMPLPGPNPGVGTTDAARIERCKSYLRKPVITNAAVLSATTLTVKSGLGTRSGDANSATLSVDVDASKGVANLAGASADNCSPSTQLIVAAELNNATYPAVFSGGIDGDGKSVTGNAGTLASSVLTRVFTINNNNAYNSTTVPFRINIEDNERQIRCASGSLFFKVTVRVSLAGGMNPPMVNSDPIYIKTNFSNSCWVQSKLVAAEPYTLNANAGHRVAIDGNWAAVLSQKDNNMGAVYMFMKSGSAWTFSKKIIMNDAASGQTLSNVALKNGILAVSNASFGAKGKIYIYKSSGTDWVYSDSFQAPENVLDQKFGIGLALGNQFLAVGASDIPQGNYLGKVYIYDYNGSNFTHSQTLTPSSEAYKFGQTVAVSGSSIIVGAPGAGSGSFTGAAFVFTDAGSSWTSTTVQKPNLSAAAAFGSSVAINGNQIAVGAERHDVGMNADVGAVYYYSNFSGPVSHTVNSNAAGSLLGSAVALSADSLYVGASTGTPEDGNNNSGFVSRLLISSLTSGGSSTTNTANGGFVHFSEDSVDNEYFGQSIASDGGSQIIVGAPAKNIPFQRSGSAYVYGVR